MKETDKKRRGLFVGVRPPRLWSRQRPVYVRNGAQPSRTPSRQTGGFDRTYYAIWPTYWGAAMTVAEGVSSRTELIYRPKHRGRLGRCLTPALNLRRHDRAKPVADTPATVRFKRIRSWWRNHDFADDEPKIRRSLTLDIRAYLARREPSRYTNTRDRRSA